MPLTIEIIESAKPREKSHKLFDSGGLYIEVSPQGGRWWRFKYRFARKDKRISLGVYPAVSLDHARERRHIYRDMLAEGIDPAAHVKAQRARRREEEIREYLLKRFTLDVDGALSLCIRDRYLMLTRTETADLRTFLLRNENGPPSGRRHATN